MKRNSRLFTLIQSANPVPDPERLPEGPGAPKAQALLEEIIAMPTQPRRRTRRRVVLLAAVGLAVLTTAAAWALVIQPEQSTNIACSDDSGELIIRAVSGDPIADCTTEFDRLGIAHGRLVAYVNEFGGVIVSEESKDVPASYQPLGEDFRQDVAIIELRKALDDEVIGLGADCYSTDEAIPIAERAVRQVGLDWDVVVDHDRIADGESACAGASLVDQAESTVAIIGIEGGPPDPNADEPPWTTASEKLHERLDAECLSLDNAAAVAEELFHPVARQLLEASGLSDHPDSDAVVINKTVDNSASCSRANINVGGIVFVDLRGPNS